jgi:hypothetical protein
MGGGGGGTRVEYVERPTAQQAPTRTAAEDQVLADQRRQMEEMQASYKSNLDRINSQYAASQTQSQSVLEQLKASAEQQRLDSEATRRDLTAANQASTQQLSLLAASRDQATTQSAESRAQQANQATSMYDRLNRRRQARRTTY